MPFDEEELDPHGECAVEIRRLRAALTAISDLQDRSFAPTKDLISVAIILARNALAEQSE